LFHPQKDLLQQCGSRQPPCAHLSGRPTIASLGCGTRPKVSTSTLHNLSSKCSIVICLLIGKSTARSWRVGCSSNDQPTMCQKRFFGNMCKSGSSLIEIRRKAPDTDRVAFQAKCNELRLLAAGAERANPVSFAIGNSWNDTLRADKQHYLEYTTRSQT